MYPRVKVRDGEEIKTIQIEKEEMSFTVRAIDSLSLEMHSSKVAVRTDELHAVKDSSPPNARISRSQLASSNGKKNNKSSESKKNKINGIEKVARISASPPKMRTTSATIISKDHDAFIEDNNTNIRASLVPMPRAVLSSPDNDGIIGSQNQLIREKQTALRRLALKNDHVIREKKLVPKRQIQNQKETECKLKREVKSPQSTGNILKEAGTNNIVKRKHSSAPRQRPPFKF